MLEPGGYVAKLYVLVTTQTRQSHTLSSFIYIWNAETKSFLFAQDLADTSNDYFLFPHFTGDFGKQRSRKLSQTG